MDEPSGSRSRRLRWAIGLLGIVTLMAIAVKMNPAAPFTQPLDDRWRQINGAAPGSGSYTWAVPMFFQYLGEAPGWLFMLVVAPLGLIAVGRWRSGLFYLSATAASTAVSLTLKNVVDRPRPSADEALGLFGPLFRVDHGSFPSGHAVTSATLAVAVAALIPPARRRARRAWSLVGALVMVGMVWQRTLINAHWLSDTVFGLVVGAGAALLTWWAFWNLLAKDYGRPVWFRHRDGNKNAHQQLSVDVQKG
jgi:undecaprenyl-diphosphatase